MTDAHEHSRKDGGYGWVITAISFFISMIELGTFKSVGVFMSPIRDSFDCSVTALGAVFAASHTTFGILVPLANMLTARFGSRRLTIAGGVVMSSSFLVMAFARNLPALSVCVIMWGIGVSFAYVAPINALLPYFPSNAALAVAITMAGSAVGMVIFPPLSEYLIEIYGWRGAVLLFAAVNANVCVFGGLIKEQSSVYTSVITNNQSAPEERTRWNSLTDAAKNISRLLSLDVLWNKPRFTVYAFACFVIGIMYGAWVIYLVPHAIERGIGHRQAAFLSSVGGLGSLVGRIVYGPILHKECTTPVQMFILCCAANIGAFFVDTVVSANYLALACVAFVNGLGLGTMAGLLIPVAQQVLSKDWSLQGWGTLAVFFALGELAGGAFAGFLHDISRSYVVSFLLLGGLATINVFVLSIERLLNLYFDKAQTACCLK